MTTKDTNPFEEGDLFLKQFLPGESVHLRRLRATIYQLNIAHKNNRMVPSILLLGERGTGKGYAAHVIAAHLDWLRASKGTDVASKQTDIYKVAAAAGMRKQTLTATPEDLAESILFGSVKGAFTHSVATKKGLFDCDGMTDVFIDEIGDATPKIQAKLLEVLETGTFRPLGVGFDRPETQTEARAIFATNKNLPELAKGGLFREDLLDRLMWMPISLPRLREQIEELPAIISRISAQISARFDLPDFQPSKKDIEWSATYDWPGNHRELQQVIWTWRLHDGSVSFREIVQRRQLPSINAADTFKEQLSTAITDWLGAIQAGLVPGFRSHGGFADEVRNIGYQALYEFNRQNRLSNDDLRQMFADQDPINVRKRISVTRGEEQ
jgi:DNA-binding NtrC family response regulator